MSDSDNLLKKTINWRETQWTEEDPFEISAPSLHDEDPIKLANYRFKASSGTELKGVILFFHGYGSWSGKFAHYAKYFSDQGYDVVGLDFRSHGRTEGQRGHNPSWDQHMKDTWSFYDSVRKEYNEDVPLIGCGFSLGGGTLLNMVIEIPDAFKALILNAPYAGYSWGEYHPAHQEALAVYEDDPKKPIFPHMTDPSPYLVHYNDDENECTEPMTAAGVLSAHECKTRVAENIDKINVDMHISIGSDEAIVDKEILKNITQHVEKSHSKIGEYHEYPGMEHNILFDGLQLDSVVESQLKFLDKIMN